MGPRTEQIKTMDEHLDQIGDEVMGEPKTMGQVVHEDLGIGQPPDLGIVEGNGEPPKPANPEEVKAQAKKESTAGQYVVLMKNDAAPDWWRPMGVYHISKGDPKKQALEADAELRALADDDGVTLKAVPRSSWENEKTYKYDRVLREID